MKKLLSLLSSVSMIGTTGATVVACGDASEKTEPTQDEREELVKQLKYEVEYANKILEENKALGEFGAPHNFVEAVEFELNEIETKVNDETRIPTLKVAIEVLRKRSVNLAWALPTNIISTTFNNWKDRDVKDVVEVDWTYEVLQKQDFVSLAVEKVAINHGYEMTPDLEKLQKNVLTWMHDSFELVYVNPEKTENNIIVLENPNETVEPQEEVEQITLEQQFIEAVKKDFFGDNSGIDLTPEFWEKHPKLTLGIRYNLEKANQFNLGIESPIITFTFIKK